MNPTSGDLRSDENALAVLAEVLAPAEEWAVLPIGRRPRLLVPRRPGKAASGMRLVPASGTAGRIAAKAASGLLRVGAGAGLPGRLVSDPGADGGLSLLGWLSQQLDQGPLSAVVTLGPPRPSRKPVLQLVDQDARTVGYAKVAVDHHTNLLVAAESRFLSNAGTAELLVLPKVLLAGSWRDRSVLVVSDLGPGGGSELDLIPAAIEAIASMGPRSREAVLDSAWWLRSGERIGKLTGTDRRQLEDCRRRVGSLLGGQRWDFGAWHGDLVDSNGRMQGSRVVLWDWERVGMSAPVGFDAVHAIFHRSARPGRPAGEALAAISRAPVLAGLGYRPEQTDPLCKAWLLELRIRLAEDRARGPLGSTAWLADLADAALA